MKHTETYAYHEARNWLNNDATLKKMVSSLCKQAWEEKWSDEHSKNILIQSAFVRGFLGWRYNSDMPAISRRSIKYWAKETWADYKDYEIRNAEGL